MLFNTGEHWGLIARSLHWIIALLVIGLYAFGLWMTDQPREVRGQYFAVHASIGISILALMLLRVLWWLVNPTPAPVAGARAWEHAAARVSHTLLYVLTFATLVIGWALSGTMRAPIDIKLFGLVPVSPLIEGRTYHRPLENLHAFLANALIVLVMVHAAAALYHHFWRRDEVMRRMLRGPSRPAA